MTKFIRWQDVVCCLLVAAVAGCAKKEDEAYDEAADTTTAMPTPAEPAVAMTDSAAAAAGAPVLVQLAAVGNSGVSGEATAKHSATDVTVDIKINGVKGTAAYPAHIHAGTCVQGGAVAAPLTSVAASNGQSTTTVAASKLNPAQPSFVQVHEPSGTPVACGDMPGHGKP